MKGRIWFFGKGTVDCTSNPFCANFSSKIEVINAIIKLIDSEIVSSIDCVYITPTEKISIGKEPTRIEEYSDKTFSYRFEYQDKKQVLELLQLCLKQIEKISRISVYVDQWMDLGIGGNCSDILEIQDDTALTLNMQDWYTEEAYRKVVGNAEKILGVSFEGDYFGGKNE